MPQNNETRIIKQNTLEQFRQKTNEISLHLGDNGLLEARLTDKVYNYNNVGSGTTIIKGNDAASKALRFETKPEETLDNTGGYVVLKNQGTITGFAAGSTVTQSGGFSATVVSASQTQILLKNTSGNFSTSQDLVEGSNTIDSAKIVRLIGEAYPVGVVIVKKNGTAIPQDLSATGFHVLNYTARIPLSGGGPAGSDFVEGEVIYQGANNSIDASPPTSTFNATILRATSTELLIKGNLVGTFNAGTIIRLQGSSQTIAGANHGDITDIDETYGNAIELNTPTSASTDDIQIISGNLVEAINEVQDDVGQIESLVTTTSSDNLAVRSEYYAASNANNTDVVGMINTLQNAIGTEDIQTIDSGDPHNTISGALNQMHNELGDSQFDDNLPSDFNYLTATHTSAINTMSTFLGNTSIADIGSPDTVTGALQSLHGEIGTASFSNDLPSDVTYNTGSRNLTGQIDGIAGFIGSTSLGTTHKTTLVGSINEIETALRGSLSNYTITDNLPSDYAYTTNNGVIKALNDFTAFVGTTSIADIRSGTSNDTVTGALQALHGEIGTASFSNDLPSQVTYSTGSQDLTGQIDAIAGFISSTSLGTSHNTTLTGAINELEGALRGTESNYNITDNLPTDFTYTVDNGVVTALNTLTQFVGNTSIANIGTTDTVTGALQKLHGEIGDITALNSTFTDDDNLVEALNELQTEVGAGGASFNALTDHSTNGTSNITAAVQAINADLGPINVTNGITHAGGNHAHRSATVHGVLDNLSAAIVSNDTDIGNLMTLIDGGSTVDSSISFTGLSATNLKAGVVELASEKLDKSNTGTQAISSNITFGGNKTFTISSGSTLEIANNATLSIAGSASGVSTFGVSFIEVDGDQTSTGMGLKIARDHISGAPTPSPALQWRESQVGANKPQRAWQLVGLDDSGNNSETADVVTFYNAEDLVKNNNESGINVTWDTGAQNFDFNVNDPTLTFTSSTFRSSGNLGSGTITNLNNTSFALNANKLDLGYSEKILLGNSDELQIFNDNTNSVISSTDNLHVRTNVFRLNKADNSENMITADGDGAVNLFHNGNAKLATAADGVDITGNTDISGNTVIGGTLQVNGNVTLGNHVSDTVTITGDLIVQGDETKLNTSTLEVEDTLILTGTAGTEPTTGGFGIETRLFSGTSVHSNAASNVTGTHSIVYNFATDRWEADGSLILSEATLSSPGVKVNNGSSLGSLSGSKFLDIIESTGIDVAGALSGNDFNITITNTDRGSSQNIFKNVAGDNGSNAVADSNNDTLTIAGGTGLTTTGDATNDKITIAIDDISGLTAGTYGQSGAEDGQYIKSVTVNAKGQVTAVTADDFDDRYVLQTNAVSANTANAVVKRDASGNFTAGTITASLTGNVSGTATNATNFNVAADNSTNSSHYVVFVGGASGNQRPNSDTTLRYNPSTNTLSSTNFAGTATVATSITATANNSTNESTYVTFVDGATGTQGIETDTTLRYNPSTNTLSSTNFSGALTGNADTATTASVATNVTVSTNNSTSESNFVTFVDGGSGSQGIETDTTLRYNPSTNTLSTTVFSGRATHVEMATSNANSNFDIPFVTALANSAANLDLDSGGNLTYNPNTNTLTAGTFIGNIAYNNVTGTPTIGDGVLTLEAGQDLHINQNDKTFSANQTGNQTITFDHDTKNTTNSTSTAAPAHGQTFTALGGITVDNGHVTNIDTKTITIPAENNPTVNNSQITLTGQDGIKIGSETQPTTSSEAFTLNQTGNENIRIHLADTTVTAGSYGDASNVATFTVDAQGRLTAAGETAIGSLNANVITAGTLGTSRIPALAASKITSGTFDTGRIPDLAASKITSGELTAARLPNDIIAPGGDTSPKFGRSTNDYVQFTSTATKFFFTDEKVRITSGGDLLVEDDIVAFSSTISDERLKGNIEVVGNALQKVSELKGVTFEWKKDGSESAGLIAQDVEKVLPSAVKEKELPFHADDDQEYKVVDYDQVTALLVEAIKELKEENKQLRADIEALKDINS